MSSPKSRFLQTQHAEPFAKLAGSLTFEEALDAAELQFVGSVPPAQGPEQAMANNYRIEGGRMALQILKRIGNPDLPVAVEPIGQLNQRA